MEKIDTTHEDKVAELLTKIKHHSKLRDEAKSTGDRRHHADTLVHLKQDLRALREVE